MKYLRWITGHPVLSLLLITVLYGLINVSNLHHWLGQEDAAPAAGEAAGHDVSTDAAVAVAKTKEAAAKVAGAVAKTEDVVAAKVKGAVAKAKEVIAPAPKAPEQVVEVIEVEKTVAIEPQAPAAAEVPTPAPVVAAEEAPVATPEAPAAMPEAPQQEVAAPAPAEVPVTVTEEAPAAAPAEAPQQKPAEAPAAGKSAGGLFNKLFAGKSPAKAAVSGDEGKAAGAQPAAADSEQKGSLFGFFKRKKPAQEAAKPEAESAAAEKAPVAPVAEQAAANPSEAPAPAAVVTEMNITTARQAFWSRDFAGATKIYEALIAKDPKNPDLYGEFGNMLIQSGNLPKGLESYEKAADLLIDQKRFNEVGSLIRFIGRYDRSKAMALVEKMPGH